MMIVNSKIKYWGLIFIIGFSFFFLLSVYTNPAQGAECVAGSDEYCLLTPLPLTDTNTTVEKVKISQYIPQAMRLTIALAGALAVVMLIWAGFQYITSDGFGKKSDAKEKIKSAIFGLLLAIGSYAIMYTINPDTLVLNLNLEGVPGKTIDTSIRIPTETGPEVDPNALPPSGPQTNLCSPDTWKTLAQTNNTRYPAGPAPELTKLINCIRQKTYPRDLGSVYTIDESNPSCNYTRGQTTCSTRCSHAINSCHYGGASGSAGALAVDFGSEFNGDAIIAAAISCGAKSARCEDSRGRTVECRTSAGATHVHVNSASCTSN